MLTQHACASTLSRWLPPMGYLGPVTNLCHMCEPKEDRATVPIFNPSIKCLGSPGITHDHMPIATAFPGHRCIDYFKTERDFDSQATWVISVLGLFLDTFVTTAYVIITVYVILTACVIKKSTAYVITTASVIKN